MTPIFDRIAWEMDMRVSAFDPVHLLFSGHMYRFDGWPLARGHVGEWGLK